MLEVEYIFQRIGVLIALREVLGHSVDGQEPALDQGEQRSVVADRVRNVSRF